MKKLTLLVILFVLCLLVHPEIHGPFYPFTQRLAKIHFNGIQARLIHFIDCLFKGEFMKGATLNTKFPASLFQLRLLGLKA
jgi:hypothetical protein